MVLRMNGEHYISFSFFFKQKTAYEMRISDWSSDVCSSDLCRKTAGDFLKRSVTDAYPPRRAARHSRHRLPMPGRAGAGWHLARRFNTEIGRASCRERVCQYV